MANDCTAPLLQVRELLHHTWGDIKPHACLVCGSGWGEIIEGLSPVSSIPYEQIHGWVEPRWKDTKEIFGWQSLKGRKFSFSKVEGIFTKEQGGGQLFSLYSLPMKSVFAPLY